MPKQQVAAVLQAFRQVGLDVVEAPQRTEPPPVADVRYVSMYRSLQQYQ